MHESDDIEEALDQYFVRKPGTQNEEASTTNECPQVHEYIPLLLRDILALDRTKYVSMKPKKVYHAFGGVVHFRSCILYARVIKRLPQTEDYTKYMIDDGSGALVLSIGMRREQLESIGRLQVEINDMRQHSQAQKQLQICDSLHRLLSKAKDQISTANIPVGSKLLVHGYPNCFKEEMQVYSFSVCRDVKISRDIEIAFKDELIHWYTRKYPKIRNA